VAKDFQSYFSHDSGAGRDPKIIRLMRVHDWYGYGIFWGLIERLKESPDYRIETDYETLAYEMRTQCERIKSVVEDFNLFAVRDGFFWSESLLSRMRIKEEKAQKTRNSANLRWSNANAMRTQCERNARKVKESKVKIVYTMGDV
jgi:hypothetical protein